jgi:hypothetical protein
MNSNLEQLLYEVPDQAKSYADSIFDVDLQDIPWGRAPQIKEVMRTSENAYDVLLAARVLTSWGDDDGFYFLESYVCDQEHADENIMPHRLHGYDDTYTQLLDALVSYWAKKATAHDGDSARKRLLRPILKIIEQSNALPFSIDGFFWLVEKKGYVEYIPALKSHLEAIIKNPKFHYWKVADCAHFLMKLDPEFVTKTLAAHGYTLEDFPNK